MTVRKEEAKTQRKTRFTHQDGPKSLETSGQRGRMAHLSLLVILLIISAVQCEAWTLDENGYPIDPPENDELEGDGIGSCPICRLIIGKVLRSIGKQLSKDNVDQVLDKICYKIKVFKSHCLHFIKKYKPKLVHVIVSGKRPLQACKHIRLC